MANSELTAFLADRDVPCPGCGYNLRGLTAGACPECNQPIELRVALSEPRLAAYLGAMCGLLAGGGMAAVLEAIFLIMRLVHELPPRLWFAVHGLPTIAALTLLGLAGLLLSPRGRIWFRKLPFAKRAGTIACCWLLTAGFVTWFLLLVLR